MSSINTLLVFCLVIGVTPEKCHTELNTCLSAQPPSWATVGWQDYAAHIVAGEGVPGNKEAALWIACTIRRDVERGWGPYLLYPGRWHGWGYPDEISEEAVALSLTKNGCRKVEKCMYLGNSADYFNNWQHLGPGVWTRDKKIVCMRWDESKFQLVKSEQLRLGGLKIE